MSDLRVRRIAELLKHETANILTSELNDPRIHDVVITRVKVTKDLGIAWLYYSSYDTAAIEDIGKGLENSAGFIRKLLMDRVHLKKLPQLIFKRDDTLEEATHLDNLLNQIRNEKDNKTTE